MKPSKEEKAAKAFFKKEDEPKPDTTNLF